MGIEYSTTIQSNNPSKEKLAGIGVPMTEGCSGIMPVSSGPYRSVLSQCSGPGALNTHPLSSLVGALEYLPVQKFPVLPPPSLR